ncbi:MAG: PilZN3 domain-containing protein [Spirochaetales bacterium]
MAVTTSQQIARFFNEYSETEVTFTKAVSRATLLESKGIYLKCGGKNWPCVLYSASMTSAKIIANIATGLNESLRASNGSAQLRLSFLSPEKMDSIAFFVPVKLAGLSQYKNDSQEICFANLQFTQRPPDDLIFVLGELLDANVNAKRRSEERITLTSHSLKLLRIDMESSTLEVDGVPRKVLFRDLSFSGCRVILMGVPKLLIDKPVRCRFVLQEPEEKVVIEGKIVRFDPVEGRQDIAVFGVKFAEESVHPSYKLRINSTLRQFRANPSTKPNE